MNKYRIAIIGCGNVGVNWHLPAYKSMNNLSIAAVCDVNEKAAKEAAKKFEVSAVYTDVDKMLLEIKPEIIALALPPFLHKEYLSKALAAGCHVIVEKPLASSPEEVKDIVSLVDKSDRKVVVDQNWRYSKISRKVKDIIKKGLIGEPYYIEMRQYGYGYSYFVTTYVGKGKKAVLFEMGPHIVDLIRYWFDSEAESVYARMPSLPHIDHPADWLNMITVNFPNDRIAYIVDDWASPDKGHACLLKGRVSGNKGSILFEFKDSGKNTLDLCCEGKDGCEEYDVTEQNWLWGINVGLTQDLIQAIEQNREAETNVRENQGTMAVIFAAYESAENRKEVQVIL